MSQDVELVAPFRLEYTYKRSVGPVISRFLTELRDGKIVGIRTSGGEVLVPPRSYDPRTGEATTGEFVEVGPAGVVTTCTAVAQGDPRRTLNEPASLALVRLDGADTGLVHWVRGTEVAPGDRVRAVFADERVGSIRDIVCFEVIDG